MLQIPEVSRMMAVRSFFCLGTISKEKLEEELANAEAPSDIKQLLGSFIEPGTSTLFGTHHSKGVGSLKAVENVLSDAFSLEGEKYMTRELATLYQPEPEAERQIMDFTGRRSNDSQFNEERERFDDNMDVRSYLTETDHDGDRKLY